MHPRSKIRTGFSMKVNGVHLTRPDLHDIAAELGIGTRDVLTKEGINATNSLQVFSVIEDTEGLSEDEIESRILSGGYDGVLITTLVDVSTREVREGGGSYYQPGPYRYGRYMHGGYMHMRQPEYYRQEETFVLETKLFDTTDSANKQAVVWSGQSELTDPSSAESALKGYSKKLVKTLVETGLIQ